MVAGECNGEEDVYRNEAKVKEKEMIRTPVHIISSSDLRENGGRYKLMGGSVIPVNHATLDVASAASDKLIGGASIPVYFVTDAELATTRFNLMGGESERIFNKHVFTGIASRGIKGRTAIPVYDPNYSPVPDCYQDKVLGYNPIAYWMLAEAAGATAIDQINSPLQDGAHVGVTLGQPGIGEPCGTTCPFYDEINDFTNVHTATFQGAFSGAAGTLAVWAKVFNVGVWTNSSLDTVFRIGVDDTNNYLYLSKSGTDNTLTWTYRAGGVTSSRAKAPVSTIDWFHMALTWDKAGDEVRAYFNGIQEGLTINGLGNWAGNITNGRVNAGAWSTLPALVWHGYVAHPAVWSTALTPAAILDLATI